MRRLISAVLFVVAATVAAAVEPDEILDDPVLEARARDLSAELRCVVCQNESIDSSNAGVARDLRLLVRERLLDGNTDQEVLDYIVARYGDFVLFRPPWKPTTYALWMAPAVIFMGGAIGVVVALRGRRQRTGDALSEEEIVELDAFLSRQGDGQ